MIVQCEGCKTRFRLADEKVRPTGTKVRCSRCGSTFLVTPPAPALPPQDEPSFNEMQTLVAPIPRDLLARARARDEEAPTRVAPVPRDLLGLSREEEAPTRVAPVPRDLLALAQDESPPPLPPEPRREPAPAAPDWDFDAPPQTFGDTYTDVTFGPGPQAFATAPQEHVRIPEAPPLEDDPLAILGPAPAPPPLGMGPAGPPPAGEPPPPQGAAEDDFFGDLLPQAQPAGRHPADATAAVRNELLGELQPPPRQAPADPAPLFGAPPSPAVERERRELFGEPPPRPSPSLELDRGALFGEPPPRPSTSGELYGAPPPRPSSPLELDHAGHFGEAPQRRAPPPASDAFVADPARLASDRAALAAEAPQAATLQRRLDPAARQEATAPWRRVLRLASGAAVLLTALACFVVARNGGQLRLDRAAFLAAFGLGDAPAGDAELVPASLHTGRYATAAGEVFFVRGTILNQADRALGPAVRVVAELRDGDRVVARGEGWAGGEPSPEQVHGLEGAEAWIALADRLGAAWSKPIAPGESAPFFVVLGGAAADAAATRLRVVASPAEAPQEAHRTVAADQL